MKNQKGLPEEALRGFLFGGGIGLLLVGFLLMLLPAGPAASDISKAIMGAAWMISGVILLAGYAIAFGSKKE